MYINKNNFINFTPLTFTKTDFLASHSYGQANTERFELINGEQWSISGWAFFADPAMRLYRIAVVDAQNGQGLGYATVNEKRKDVVSAFPMLAPLICGYTFSLPHSFCPDDPVNTLMFYGLTEDESSYMDIPSLGAMLPLQPFFRPDEDIAPELLPFLYTEDLIWADITATHHCNIDCKYCCLYGKHHDIADAEFENIKRFVENTGEVHIGYWQMSNLGEITCYPHWVKLAEVIKQNQPYTILSNFCKQFNDEELLILAQAKYLTISLDTTDSALLKKIRGGADAFKIVANIASVRELACKANLPEPIINLSTVVSRPVIPYLPSLALLASSLNVRHMLLQDVSKEDASPDQADDLFFEIDDLPYEEAEALNSAMVSMLDILKRSGIAYTLMSSLRQFEQFSHTNKLQDGSQTKLCLAPWTRMYIGINGNINPCAHIPSVGKITEFSTLRDIVNGLRLSAIRYGLLTGNMAECCIKCRYGRSCSCLELKDRIEFYRVHSNGDDVYFGLFE